MDDRENQEKSAAEAAAAEAEPEVRKKESSSSERENVDAAEEDNGVEARAEGVGDEDWVPERQSLVRSPHSSYEISSLESVPPEVAVKLADAEARRVAAELRIRELEMHERAEVRAAEARTSQEDTQAFLEQERHRQEAETRKAEAAQAREKQKQMFELRKNAWAIDKMRGLVSVMLVVGFLVTTLIVILLNALGQAEAALLQTVASLYSGITGAVLGFYFGRQQNQ
jgi:hypothetical protein